MYIAHVFKNVLCFQNYGHYGQYKTTRIFHIITRKYHGENNICVLYNI